MKIYIATKNINKVELVKKIFTEEFTGMEIIVDSGDAKSEVPDTPWEEQTFNGAKNRAKNSRISVPGYDYYIGLETGLVSRYGELFEEAWCVITNADNKEFSGYASGYLISKDIKIDIQNNKDTNTRVLIVWDATTNDFVMYTGNKDIRKISLNNAITSAISQIKYI